jgi:hypothetical protein
MSISKEQIKTIINYLQSVIDFNPVPSFLYDGECMYCHQDIQCGESHKQDCHYLEAKRLLEEFKGKSK